MAQCVCAPACVSACAQVSVCACAHRRGFVFVCLYECVHVTVNSLAVVFSAPVLVGWCVVVFFQMLLLAC